MPSLREAAPTARQGRTPVPYGGKPAYRAGFTAPQLSAKFKSSASCLLPFDYGLWTVDYGLMAN
ncbi:hypothetical protein [Nostoc sp. NIES-3756]|uniref:hypothetical protein n=1 Tax=Nostoc sp. NIES-3756 TaxID=1751286 RepID=UPI000A5E6994|nr:hypothetical protein [Nostoc sp. NIES-3756]